jgi:Ca-activated chloride channel family protein
MNVANIMPKDTIDIELHYTELLVPTSGTYEFVYPTVVGPRYSNQSESDSPETDKWIKNPYLKQGSKPRSKFNIGLNISTGIAIQDVVCPSHETEVFWEDKSFARILLSKSENFGGNRDFILHYRLSGKKIESGLLLYPGQDENFFMLMVQPPERVTLSDIPSREYIFVVDVSGSMNGFPLNTAKKLLKNLIGNLRKSDKFNVILFAGGSKLMASSSVSATAQNIHNAIRMIDRQKGGGGTELHRALKNALSLPRDEATSRTVLVITDGYIAAEQDVFHLIQNNLNRTNVFSFGIGSSVNRYLIEGIAKAGQGEPFIVTQPRHARNTAERFRDYVQSPVLTNISVQYDGFETYDIEPVAIPDLFAQRPVIVIGKWRGEPEGIIKLTGTSGTGEYVQTFKVSDAKPLETNNTLRYLWARSRIARLSDFNFKNKNSENKAEITTLGLTYNLLTAYTSFIAVHEVVRNPEAQNKDVHQPLPLPLNVSNLAVGCSVSTVPEPELYVLLLMALLIVAMTIGYRKLGSSPKEWG